VNLDRPYCTVRDVQDETLHGASDHIETFTKAINQASREIDWFCRRDFLFHDHTSQAFSVPAHMCQENVITLPWPVITITEVKVIVPPDSGAVLDPSEYQHENFLLSASSKIYRAGRWRSGEEFTKAGILPSRSNRLPTRIELKGTFGYLPAQKNSTHDFTAPSPSIPAEIRHACACLAGVRSGRHKKEIVDRSGDRQTVTLRSLPRDVEAMLMRFQVPILP
jgi:hypothetical protein